MVLLYEEVLSLYIVGYLNDGVAYDEDSYELGRIDPYCRNILFGNADF